MEKIPSKQKVAVFQLNRSGEKKIAGLKKYGQNRFELEIHSFQGVYPEIIDDCSSYLPAKIEADLVLNFLTHPDLSHDLVHLCSTLNIPVISSGKKISHPWGHTPITCCGLASSDNLGLYGQSFGAPVFEVKIKNNTIQHITIIKGASCGATWEAARKVIGMPLDDAKVRIGLETQFFCHADPAGWDPINGKSPLHFAGKMHAAALKNAIESALDKIIS